MRILSLRGLGIKAAMLALAFAATTGAAHAELQISKCKTRALIGGGLGALAGSMIAGKGDKTEGAIIGGALGAGAGFGICKWMDARSQARVEAGYAQAAQKNKAYSSNWKAEDGTNRSLAVAKPVKEGNCRVLNSTMTAGGSKQALPQEKYCQDASGVWRPA